MERQETDAGQSDSQETDPNDPLYQTASHLQRHARKFAPGPYEYSADRNPDLPLDTVTLEDWEKQLPGSDMDH